MNPFKRIWDTIEKWYLDSRNPTIIELLFSLITSIIACVILISNFSKIISPGKDITLVSIVIGLVVFFIITITLLVRKIRLFRYQILERNKFIEVMVKKYDPSYIIKNFHETHEIKKNGDGIFKRDVTLEYTNEIVPWYEMYLGSTNQIPLENNIKLKVVSSKDHQPLANLPYKREDEKSFHAIILNPILTPHSEESGFSISRYWPKIWKDLVTKYDDNGSINLKYFTKSLSFTFILPKEFQYTSYSITPKVGKWNKETDHQERECLTFTALNLQPRKYTYKLSVRRLL